MLISWPRATTLWRTIGRQLAAFAFWCSSKTALQTSTHSLHIHTRLERSDGFEMSVSTWSSVLLQNEHLRTSSSSWHLRNISPVWQVGAAGFKIRKGSTWRCHRVKALVSAEHRKMLPPGTKRLLSFGRQFRQSESLGTEPTLARFSPLWPRHFFPQTSALEVSGPVPCGSHAGTWPVSHRRTPPRIPSAAHRTSVTCETGRGTNDFRPEQA